MARRKLANECFIPQIDLEAAILNLTKRTKNIKTYFDVMEESTYPDAPAFQKKYDAFYRVRRNEAWRKE